MGDGDKRWRGSDRNLLSSVEIRSAGPGLHRDGGGLFLQVDDNGRRWLLRSQHRGRRRDFGLGSAFDVKLAEARKRAEALKRDIANGIDPVAVKAEAKRKSNVPTFEAAAKEVHKQRQESWSNGKHVDQWINTLIAYAFPTIGARPVDQVTSGDIVKVLTPIWHTKRETASRVRQRIATVMDWAKVAGHRSGDNPCALIEEALGRQKETVEHHSALPFQQVGAFLRALRNGPSEDVTKLAFELLILTAVRTTEIRGAVWDEFDLRNNLWTIPAERMKARKPHVVPLTSRAVEILEAAAKLNPNAGFVFRDPLRGDKLSENRFLNARDAIGFRDACTPHGFRSSFRDWGSETTNFPSEVIEMALAHAIKSKVEAAYRRGDLLEKRRQLMAAWAQYVWSDTSAARVPAMAK